MSYEKHTLYVDNFRGFRDAHIPISDVNFLVGENSSGKTSLISILQLMSEPRLLVDSQFVSDDVNLGTFDDIASTTSHTAKVFRVGMTRWNTQEGNRYPLGMLVSYEKYEGLPRDTCFSCTFGDNKEVALRRVGAEVFYKSDAVKLSPTTDIRGMLDKWASEHGNKTPPGNFKRLNITLEPDQSLLYPLSLVAQGLHLGSASPHHVPLLDARIFPSLTWVAPIRTKPRRTYDELRRGFSSEGTHTPYLIRKILDTKAEAERFRQAIETVGRDSGLFKSVDIKRFGSDVTAPFQVRIVLDRRPFNMTNVGYGVSQALPVMVEVLWRDPGSWFAIQQPEVHLHPRAQAALGALIFAMAESEGKRFIIETHSDFMIDRYRLSLKRTKSKKKLNSQILFFERRNGRNTVVPITISEQGDLAVNQPPGYREFFVKEQIDILGL